MRDSVRAHSAVGTHSIGGAIPVLGARRSFAQLAALCAAGALLACASPVQPGSEPIDFAAVDPWSVHVVTVDEDGDERVTRIWIVNWGTGAAIRTGDSRWMKNLERSSTCRIRADGVDYPVGVDFVTNLVLRRKIDEAFLRKYGWQERLAIGSNRAESADNYLQLTPLRP